MKGSWVRTMSVALAGLGVIGATSRIALADGTEALGPPSIPIAAGTGIVAAGTGLDVQPGVININVPAGTTIEQVLLYWSGEFVAVSDDTIEVDGNPVVGTLIGGPSWFFENVNSDVYRADITGLGLVSAGANALTVGGLSYDFGNSGAGILVVYNDGGMLNAIDVRDGSDLAFIHFPEPRKSTVAQTYILAAAAVDRTADLAMFFGSVGGDQRPNAIEITVDGALTTLVNELGSFDGSYWDTLTVPVSIPAGATTVTVQAFSRDDGSGNLPASFNWIASTLSVPFEPPDGGCTLTQGYWKTHSEYGPAPYDDTWALLPAGADSIFFLSEQSYYQVLWTSPRKGNAYYILAHQYIAAELNQLNGTDIPADVLDAFNEATTILATYTPRDLGSRSNEEVRDRAIELAGILDVYNNGPMHCWGEPPTVEESGGGRKNKD